jgi:hypothetical protein
MRHKLLVLLMASALTLAVGNAALALTVSHVTIRFNPTTSHFHGRVSSPNAECRAHRAVGVFKRTASGPVRVGHTTTGPRGGWSDAVMHPHGQYFAVTPQQKVMGITCGRAKSGLIAVM